MSMQPYGPPHQPQYWSQPPAGRSSKDLTVAYVLWLFLGNFGIHKFYVGKEGMGALYLGLGFFGWLTAIFLVGFLLLIPLWILLIVDLFTLPDQVRAANRAAYPQVPPGYGTPPQGW